MSISECDWINAELLALLAPPKDTSFNEKGKSIWK